MTEQKNKKEDISQIAFARSLTDFIKINDKQFSNENLDHHSITDLVIIKTTIEIRITCQKLINSQHAENL